jgi:hypothetical protein
VAAPRGASILAGTPWALLAGLAAVVVSALVLAALAIVPRGVVDVVAIAAGHGALLATALGWAGVAPREALAGIGLLAMAAVVARAHPLGALAYLAVPLWILRLARQGRLVRLGLGTPCPPAALALGVLAGTFLGAHVLVSATLTFGYRAQLDASALLPWLLFDLGAHVPATEAFFRGALFNRAQRRWSLGAGVMLATAATVLRYLVDPLLPHVVELVVGTVFYVSLLSVTTCWLYWRFGSLVPGLAAWLGFFAAYRTLGAG